MIEYVTRVCGTLSGHWWLSAFRLWVTAGRVEGSSSSTARLPLWALNLIGSTSPHRSGWEKMEDTLAFAEQFIE